MERRVPLWAAVLAAVPLAATGEDGPPKLETVAAFEARPGNPAVTPDGRVVVTMSSLAKPAISVNEVGKGGKLTPFPNKAWASKPGKDGRGIAATIGIRATPDGCVWVLDMGDLEHGHAPQLVGWDTKADRLKRAVVFPNSVLRPSSFCQDFVIVPGKNTAVVADMTFDKETGRSDHPAFLVVDLETGLVRRVLESHKALMPSGEPITIGGRTVGHQGEDGKPVVHHYGLNPIAIDPKGEWVYFGAMSGRKVYRVPAAVFADASRTDDQLAAEVKEYRDKPHCDGMAVDGDGNVYVTDVENNAVGVAGADGYRTLARDAKRLAWPDGLALTADGWLYVTANQLHNLPALNGGKDDSDPPYYLHRIRVRANGR